MIDITPEPDPLIKAGRYQIYRPGATKATAYTRVTNFIGALDNAYGLSAWKMREVAKGIANSGSLRAELHANVDNHRALDDICERAIQSVGSNEKRDLGSAIHRLTEMVDDGTIGVLEDGDPLTHAVAEYQRVLEDYGLEVIESEQVVVLDELTVAGRFDRIVSYRAEPTILDIKTGRSKPANFARQLAIYAHADTIYDPSTRVHRPMPAVNLERALVLMLPVDGTSSAELLEIDISAGWDDALLCAEVRKRGHRMRNELARPAATVLDRAVDSFPGSVIVAGPTPEERRAAIQRRIDALKDNERVVARLKRSWPANARTKPWPVGQLGAIESLVSTAEAMAARPPEWFTLQDRYAELNASTRALARSWADEADAAGHHIDSGASPEHFAIASTMCTLLQATDDIEACRTIIELAIEGDVRPDVPLGVAWVGLTADELATVERIARAISARELAVKSGEIVGHVAPLLVAV